MTSPVYVVEVGSLEWRSEPPTEPGWYWCYATVERERRAAHTLWVTYLQEGFIPVLSDRWLGPIPQPEVPKS